MSVTMEQIAQRAKISRAGVSMVLNGKAGHLRPETRDRVLRVAREMDYRPNTAARAIRKGAFGCIGLLLSSEPHHSDLLGQTLSGIQDALAKKDLRLTVASLPNAKLTSEQVMPNLLREWSCDGLIINYVARVPARMLELIDKYRIPSVWMNAKQEMDRVYPDDFQAGVQATEHLLRLGHQRIAYVNYSGVGHYSTVDRRDGYIQAMVRAGLKPQVIEPNVPGSIARSQRVAASIPWLTADDRPTAVLTYSATTAQPILWAAGAELRMRIPQDLSVMTFDDHPCDSGGVAIDTMILPGYDLGQVAAEMLFEKIETTTSPLPSRALPLTLERGSSCTNPSEQARVLRQDFREKPLI